MRDLARNQRPVYYALFDRIDQVTDTDGYLAGQKAVYHKPVKMMACVHHSSGISTVEPFGTFQDYDLLMTTHDMACPIDENTVIWAEGATPNEAADNWNYRVNRVSPYLNMRIIMLTRTPKNEH